MDKLLTPQQELFLSLYTNPKSETFSNALQSALKAGYAQQYAENITHSMPEWLSENIGKRDLLKKAERVLNKTLDLDTVDENGKVDSQLLAIQNKTAHFVAETVGKNDGYSKRTELTGKDGGDITFNLINYGDNNSIPLSTETIPDTSTESTG